MIRQNASLLKVMNSVRMSSSRHPGRDFLSDFLNSRIAGSRLPILPSGGHAGSGCVSIRSILNDESVNYTHCNPAVFIL